MIIGMRPVHTPLCPVCGRTGLVYVDSIKWLAYDAGHMIQSLSLNPVEQEQFLTGIHEECKIIDNSKVVA